MRDEYLNGLAEYHKYLEQLVHQNYGLKAVYLENIAWGYTTTVFYLKSPTGEYIVRISDHSKTKLAQIDKDIQITNLLKDIIPTPVYLANTDNRFTTVFVEKHEKKRKLLRISKHIEGVPPFEMTPEILRETLEMVAKVHKFGVEQTGKPLLHGDLTPSNILVAHGKIVSMFDFENSTWGPIEQDLGHMVVFFWLRMSGRTFEQVLKLSLQSYPQIAGVPNAKLVRKICVLQLKKHLKNIEINKSNYQNVQEWEMEYVYFKQKLSEILEADPA